VFAKDNVKDKCVAAILEHAATHKIHSTYLANNLPAVRATGKLYGEFNQMGTKTGRFSATNPNLQNIPIRKGKEIRDLFIAGDGHKLVVNDYSQVELRILAHYTQDPLLLKAYTEGFDLHSATARNAYGIPEDQEPSTRQRSLAKNVNFSMVYGATAYTLVQRYEVPEDEAEALVQAFYSTYRRVAPWQAKVIKECRKRARSKKRHGYHVDPYVETILGRRRRLPEIIFPDTYDEVPGRDEGTTYGKLRRRAERQAINSVIQGTAADIMKMAMVRLHDRIVAEGLPLQILMQVHDEVVVRTPKGMAEEAEAIIRESMESVNMLSVPLVAEGTICDRWAEAK
jgi:DNA polymerase-1